MCAFRNRGLVSLCDATHWRRASTLQALLEVLLSKSGGERSGYTETISCRSAAIVPTECQMKGASSEKCSRYLDNSSRALSRFSAYFNSSICLIISFFSCSDTPEFIIKEMLPICLKNHKKDVVKNKKEVVHDCGLLSVCYLRVAIRVINAGLNQVRAVHIWNMADVCLIDRVTEAVYCVTREERVVLHRGVVLELSLVHLLIVRH